MALLVQLVLETVHNAYGEMAKLDCVKVPNQPVTMASQQNNDA